MSPYRFLFTYLKRFSLPVFNSIMKAYKHTTSNPGESQSRSSGKQHPMDDFMKNILSKTNLTAPPLDSQTALKILNIEPEPNKQLQAWHILQRYWPENGGSVYLQCKALAAKEILMSEFPNASQIEQSFYEKVVLAEEQAQKGQEDGSEAQRKSEQISDKQKEK